MNPRHRDLDDLLRQNVERQLAGFDRDRQRQMVSDGLSAAGARHAGRRKLRRFAAAAVLILAIGCICLALVHVMKRETVVVEKLVEGDTLLASTDPMTILLTGSMRLLVANDPTLTPHSLWDQ